MLRKPCNQRKQEIKAGKWHSDIKETEKSPKLAVTLACFYSTKSQV